MSKSNHEDMGQASEICKFYSGKTVFITGATGFLGSVLLEILLRCCPDIYRIYILLRSKKGVKAEDRKDFIFNKNIFTKLKTSNPDALKKVIVLSGNVSQGNLGMTENVINNLTEEVSVVFHMAATISFRRPLGFVVRQNVIGTSNVIDFCKKSKKLEVLVYTSSAFSNCNQKKVTDENVHDLPFSTEELVKLGRNADEDGLMKLFNMCSPPFPNFYLFSKCVTENLLKETANELPICIIRPSIIISCLKGPLPGYVERGAAIFTLCEGVGKGFIRVIRVDESKRLETIPVDVVANCHVVGAFRQVSKSLPSPSVYNCVSGEQAVIKWKEWNANFMAMNKKTPVPQAYVYPMLISCTNGLLYKFLAIILHYIPAIIVEFLLWISGSKISLWKIYRFYDKSMETVIFFTLREWNMLNENFQSLSKGLDTIDKEMFYLDLKDFTIENITRNFPNAADIYQMNGKPYIEKLRMRYLRYFLTFILVGITLGSIFSIFYLILLKIWQ